MEKMYEVLRFVEKGTECQPGIDCLQGELLIYYLRDNTKLDKASTSSRNAGRIIDV